ncbi:ATPase [Alphaproteobacteria bacterium]|nr:ATPase [Alphaproteobacteria bacterium]
MLIKREEYQAKLRALRDKNIIKVISGVRRSGKSKLLQLFQEELREDGVSEQQIITYDFEDLEVKQTYMELYREIKQKLQKNRQNYIFLDEIQRVDEWEKLVDGLYVLPNTDVYITGSNAFLLSGKLATYLSGRHIEISILPLSFREYLEFFDDKTDLERKFADYAFNGGMPQSFEMFHEDEKIGVDYLKGVYSTVILKDVTSRDGAEDGEALENILRFLFQNVGSLVSPKKIADYMKSNYRTIDPRKVERLIKATVDAFILYGVNRYDIKGKELLQTQQKYYLVDTGFRQVLLSQDESNDSGRVLENIVYLELIRRGYQVWIGKTKSGKEVDFVARGKDGNTEYYQVADTMRDFETREREVGALEDVKDHNPKYIITRDAGVKSYDGVRQVNVIDWLVRQPNQD